MIPAITTSIVQAVRQFLGMDGIELFRGYLRDYGTVAPVIPEKSDGKTFPWVVHFREGMQIRNFMRGLPDCKKWKDADLDNYWSKVVEEAIKKACE